MSQSPRHRNVVMDTYNKIVQNDIEDPLKLLQSTIERLKREKSNVAEISLLYCLQSDYYFENGFYDEAYKFIMDAAQIDSERKEVLQSLINIHTPQTSDSEGNKNKAYSSKPSNPYEDDEKAHQYCTKLEALYPDDTHSLYVASHCYSALGLYDNAIHILKRAFSKLTSSLKQSNNPALDGSTKDFAEEIKKRITQTYIDRYSNCPNDAHETIIRYLVELIEWKYNDFDASNLQTCIEEIWERIEYVLNKHMDSATVHHDNNDVNKMQNEWNTIWKILGAIPCSIPLSTRLLNYIFEIFILNTKYEAGVEFFTRLITEYQTFNENMLNIHAKFDRYDVLYLNRAKLYHALGAKQEMLDDIEDCNVRMLCDGMEMEKETVNEANVAQYVIKDANEKPIIETEQQIKKRRASRVSNINISPMPKQYREFHLTPKNKKKSTLRRRHGPNKRYSMNEIAFDRICRDEKKESEELQSIKNARVLESKIVDLQNDLHRETSKKLKFKKEIEKLQHNIVQLTDNLADAVVNNAMDDTLNGGNGENTKMDAYHGKLKGLETEINGLKVVDANNKETIKSLKRQIAILKDCKMKLNLQSNHRNSARKVAVKTSISSRICGFCMKVTKLLVGVVAFIFVMVLVFAMVELSH